MPSHILVEEVQGADVVIQTDRDQTGSDISFNGNTIRASTYPLQLEVMSFFNNQDLFAALAARLHRAMTLNFRSMKYVLTLD